MTRAFENVIFLEKLKSELSEVFEELIDILNYHSGPFASNSVISSRWRQANDVDEFTKDGIRILRHLLVSEKAVARFAARMTRFVGITVDSRCHDGTTTSMLLFAKLALIAIEYMDSHINDPRRYRWAKSLEELLNLCFNYLKNIKITENDILQRCLDFGIETKIEEVRSSLAYYMAMVSSKQDDDLSRKIAEVIKRSPKKIYGIFKDSPLLLETEERYILSKQEHDLIFSANIGNPEDFNYKNDTQYLAEDCVIFATGNDIADKSLESSFLVSFISDHPSHIANLQDYENCPRWADLHEGKKKLIIIAPMISSAELMTEILKFNIKNPNNKISYFISNVKGRIKTTWNRTLHYMAGVPLFTDVLGQNTHHCLIGLNGISPRVHLIGTNLSISNLYEKEEGEIYHPLYRNPEKFKPYTDFAKETEDLIVFAQTNVSHQALDKDELTVMMYYYRCLTCQEVWDIDIGGSVHDQYANRTVYEDAMGAALSAVDEGVILGGYAHLAKFIKTIKFDESELFDMFYEEFISLIENSLHVDNHLNEDQSLDSYVRYLIEQELSDKWSYIVADANQYKEGNTAEDWVYINNFDKEILEKFLKKDKSALILFQAYAGYEEQFKRFKTMLPMLSMTSHLADMRRKDDEDVR